MSIKGDRTRTHQSAVRLSDPRPSAAPVDVLAIGNSPVNLIVISRIAEGTGLSSQMAAPPVLSNQMRNMAGAIIVLDEPLDDPHREHFVRELVKLRQSNEKGHPFLVILSNQDHEQLHVQLQPLVTALIRKPFTSDQLQPMLAELSAR